MADPDHHDEATTEMAGMMKAQKKLTPCETAHFDGGGNGCR
jgi:hypothetical protein